MGFFSRAVGLVFISVFSAAPSFGWESSTPYIDRIEAHLSSRSAPSLDDFIESLPAEWRSNFLLAYDSRSRQTGTPAEPRVILHSLDNQFFLAFAGPGGTKPGDQQIEMIETYGLRRPRFALIQWKGNKPSLQRNPAICASCHQGAHIFDTYPNWPGFVGSSDDGLIYGESSGSGELQRMAFEGQILENLKASAVPRYHALLGLADATVGSQARQNTFASSVMSGQLQNRMLAQILNRARTIDEVYDDFLMSFPFQSWENESPGVVSPEIATEPRFAKYRDFVTSEIPAYHDAYVAAASEAFARFKTLVAKDGTPADQEIFDQCAYPFSMYEPADPFSGAAAYDAGRKHAPLCTAVPGMKSLEVMNYFSGMDTSRMPGLFYKFWLTEHPEVTPLPLNTGLPKPSIWFGGGTTFDYIFANFILGSDYSGRNYRDFDELYAWVPSPLKRFSWKEFSRFPAMAEQVDQLQKTYLSIIQASPLLSSSKPWAFRKLRSWSPENRKQLEQILSSKSPDPGV